jgi:beta-lactam-binding protein with PASTA domain
MFGLGKKSFLFNLGVLVAVCIVLYFLFFTSLGFLTNHNKEMKVPNVIGRNVGIAIAELHRQGFDATVDSAFEPDAKPYTILAQQPDTSAVVKRGRTLFLTVNKAEPPQTSMPNLVGLSYRSAALILRSNRLLVGDTSYRPDIAKGAVLEQLVRGEKISPGSVVPQGSRIDLVLGDGLGETEMNVPDLIGQTYPEAMAVVGALGLQPNLIFDADVTDTMMAVVYDQQPRGLNEMMSHNRIREGDIIDIFVKQNPTPEELERNRMPRSGVTDDDGYQ